jgi:hypothetical protein
MGFIDRRRSGNVFSGSKLNVPGQGIYTVKKGGVNKPTIKKNDPPKQNGNKTI